MTKLRNSFRAEHLRHVIIFTKTKVTAAAKVTIVTTEMLQMHAPLHEEHSSTAYVNKNVLFCPILIKVRVSTNFSKISNINFQGNSSDGVAFFHADGQREGVEKLRSP